MYIYIYKPWTRLPCTGAVDGAPPSQGWEWATLELGLLVTLLCTEWPPRSLFPRLLPTPTPVLWLLRLHTSRATISAALAKLGEPSKLGDPNLGDPNLGDPPSCWRTFSCGAAFHATQPMPTPLSFFLHHLPTSLQRMGAAVALFAQLLLPFLTLVPWRPARLFAFWASALLEVRSIGLSSFSTYSINIYIYIYVCVCVCVCVYIYRIVSAHFGHRRASRCAASDGST